MLSDADEARAVVARRVFGSEAEAQAFLTTPHPELDRDSPIEVARTVRCSLRVRRILTALEYGLAL